MTRQMPNGGKNNKSGLPWKAPTMKPRRAPSVLQQQSDFYGGFSLIDIHLRYTCVRIQMQILCGSMLRLGSCSCWNQQLHEKSTREDSLWCLALGRRLLREVGLMVCAGYIKSAWRTGAVWELLAERKHRTKSQCDWPSPPRLYLEVAYFGENRAFFFPTVSLSRVDNQNFVGCP